MTLVDIHARLATTTLLFAAALGFWGLYRAWRKQGVDGSYWGALVIGELLVLAQGGLGLYLYLDGARPAQTLHILYGVVSALTIPAVFAATRGHEEKRDMLVYGASLLFLGGLVLRAMMTG